jgi:hypothetical protein
MSKKTKSLRLRKPAVQVELDLPPPPGFSAADAPELELTWWQKPVTVIVLAAVIVALLVVATSRQHSRTR